MAVAGDPQIVALCPEPLAPGSFIERLGTLGLPAATLSIGSLLTLVIVLAAVQHSAALRSDYSLPALPARWLWLIALGSAALAWSIVSIGSRRPGPFWPRLWALSLALAASLVVIGTLVQPLVPSHWLPSAQLHALVTAVLAAVLSLTPRLARIRPDSVWIARIAPLTFLTTLALILPPALLGSFDLRQAPGPDQVRAMPPTRDARLQDSGGADQRVLDLMQRFLFAIDGRDYRASDIAALWDIDLATAKRLPPGGRNGCIGKAASKTAEYRIDCAAYGPAARGQGADPRAEIRIVYSAKAGPLTDRSQPAEIWYAFAIPGGTARAATDGLKRQTINAFFDALPAGTVDSGRRAMVDQGFRVKHGIRAWKVQPPRIERYLADREWIVIRVIVD
ncbi:hypothetical protein [uncultured Lamprocystis sp.]|jgi:hypothetical protein|uniref:hypothetical protein n=1 Tax=uncultured Lamprocystis sp. TaxID=543132 RepID=UPI0025F8B46B|nr:hypothetical protein [uncultured Lamprocystis sp.]